MQRKNEARWIESRQRWQINVQAEGERRTFTSSVPGTKGKVAAERKADKWLDIRLVDENTRLEVMADTWIKNARKRCGKAYCDQYEKYMRLYIKPLIGKKRIGKVTEGDFQNVIDTAYKERDLAEKTLKNIAGCLMAFLKYCRINKATTLVIENKLIIPHQAKKGEKTILGENDLKTLLTNSDTMLRGRVVSDPYIWMYRFMVTYGLRPGENCALMNSDIDGDIFSVRRAYNSDNELTDGKNNNARRIEKISKTGQWIFDGQKQMLKSIGISSVYIFPDIRDGSIVTQRTVRTYWQRYCKYHEIKDATTPYELRHTFCSINVEMPDYLKKQVMGHSKNMDTNGTYGHKKLSDMQSIADYIDGAIAPYSGTH